MMHKWNYGQEVLVLPAAALDANATAEQLHVLLWLASDPSLSEKPAQLGRLAGCSKRAAEEALVFWCAQGVLSETGSTREDAPEKQGKSGKKSEKSTYVSQKTPRVDLTPQYTTAELADMMEQRESLRLLIDAGGNVLGRVIQKVSDVRILASFLDYYGYDEEFVLLLLKYCKEKKDKTSLGWIEKFALGLRDDYGIETVEALENWIRNDERRRSLEGRVRRMFGIKDRELVPKEKQFLLTWASYGYGEDVVRRAYELTVASIKEASMDYANGILERWHAEGLQTLAEIDVRLDAERAEKKAKVPTKGEPFAKTGLGNSFDTDDFFEAALKRSFGEEKKNHS